MSRRGVLILALLGCGLVVPVIVGTSCPPPSNPPFISLNTGTSTTNLRILPCEPNRVCVDVINQACVDTEVVLYTHNGFDVADPPEYPIRYSYLCCENPNSPAPCPCSRPGALNGEMQLSSPELYRAVNRTPFIQDGDIVTTLPAKLGRIRRSFPCDQIKSIGIDVGGVGDLPANPQERSSVHYRCTMLEVEYPNWWYAMTNMPIRAEEHVACGATLQFRVYDRNDCASPALTVYRIDPQASKDCKGVVPEAATEQQGNTGG